jgi:hypothetical protein
MSLLVAANSILDSTGRLVNSTSDSNSWEPKKFILAARLTNNTQKGEQRLIDFDFQ